jgi:putative NADH-flavin reductase
MKVERYGASGMLGSRIFRELVNRGHPVTAVVRNPSHITEPKVTVLQGDILDEKSVTATAQGADVAISAYGPGPASPAILVSATTTLVSGLCQAGVRRFLNGWRGRQPRGCLGTEARRHPEFSGVAEIHLSSPCRRTQGAKTSDLDWTSVSPAALIHPGERTGTFRLGKDAHGTESKGKSRISTEDFAAALVEEVEKPRHIRQRFTVAYGSEVRHFSGFNVN